MSSLTNLFKKLSPLLGAGAAATGIGLPAAVALGLGSAAISRETNRKAVANQQREANAEVTNAVNRQNARITSQGLQISNQEVKSLYADDYKKIATEYGQRKRQVNRSAITGFAGSLIGTDGPLSFLFK